MHECTKLFEFMLNILAHLETKGFCLVQISNKLKMQQALL